MYDRATVPVHCMQMCGSHIRGRSRQVVLGKRVRTVFSSCSPACCKPHCSTSFARPGQAYRKGILPAHQALFTVGREITTCNGICQRGHSGVLMSCGHSRHIFASAGAASHRRRLTRRHYFAAPPMQSASHKGFALTIECIAGEIAPRWAK